MKVKLNPRAYFLLFGMITFIFLSTSILHAQVKDSVLSKIQKLRIEPNFSEESPAYIDLLLDLSRTYLFKDSDSLLIRLDQAYDLSIKTNYKAGESRALHFYGFYHSQSGDSEKAFDYNTQSLRVSNTYGIKDQKIYALNNLALDYWAKGENAVALTHFLEALSVAEEIKDKPMMSVINDNIGILYGDNGDYNTALTFHEKSKEINLITGNADELASTLLNMAVIYVAQKKYDEASTAVDKCIAIFEKSKKVDWMSHSYEVKGSIALELKKFDEALVWYNKSKDICDNINYEPGYTRTYAGLAEAYSGLGNHKKAEDFGLSALHISTKLNIAETIKTSNRILAEVYHAMGQDKLAYQYQTAYQNLYEKNSEESFKKGLGILRSEMKFENQKKELIENNEKALAQQKLYSYIAIFILIILSILLLSIYRTNKIQKRFNKVLVARESELEAANKTKNKLFSVIAHDLKGPINSFYSLMKLYLDNGFSKEESQYIFPKALQEIGGISEMLNNLLEWGKTQMHGAITKQQEVDIHQVTKATILFLNPLATKKGILLYNKVAENSNVLVDQDHLEIIMRNLISNAIKFTGHDGEINITTSENENMLQINVQDNGVGMDLETSKKLFENSTNKSTFGTNNEKGTGLGLALCKDLIESNGGTIWVNSIKNEGTTVSFTLPVKPL